MFFNTLSKFLGSASRTLPLNETLTALCNRKLKSHSPTRWIGQVDVLKRILEIKVI